MYVDNDGLKVTPDELPAELEPTQDLLTEVYQNALIVLPCENMMARGEVVYRKLDVDVNPIGRENANPILNSRRYQVDFDNGEVTKLTTNVIMERISDQCDKNENALLLIYSFIECRKSDWAMCLQDQKITVNGRACKKRSTDGWEICVIWKDQSTTWERLDDLK